ncbi:Sec20-domain-containing protein [Wallemia mellicola]|uniref:Sec20-domain-containing protein n=1 Tax=Wallemia mellicola TaxID=1708541 RepID=A0A4T0M336_9BASI|nr:hypothetical protein E3Q24_03957 [Wallemia mellicola]TIB76984.1 Sec20-domain-containing protein [Wallemia mellicola]TIB90251.1 Sec20-domain-containing protein [Wallemia mellicola]TIB98083.1 Sec20-domain-containing protein [Wallemia mellicola]TIC21440.1 Sec20-domain-containing protein [Wallemia mellicola]
MENAINQLNIKLDDIDHVDIPNLLSLDSATTVKVHNDSVANIRNKFNTIQQSVDEVIYDTDDTPLEVESKKLQERLQLLRIKFRSAALSSKRKIDSADNTELFERARKPNNEADNSSIDASTDQVTDALIKTTQMMKANLDQSIVNHQTWQESSDLITTTLDQYFNFTDLLNNSKVLLKQLERGNMLDKLAIFASILFFSFCVLFVLKRRVYDKGATVLSILFKPLKKGSSKVIENSHICQV